MKIVRKLTSTILSLVFFALCPAIVFAVGLGNIRVLSLLNEPLKAEIPLEGVKETQLKETIPVIASYELYEKTGLTRADWLTSIVLNVSKSPKTGKYIIQLSTKDPVQEPYVDLLIELTWPDGKLVKEYTLLLDPPKVAFAPIDKVLQNPAVIPINDVSFSQTPRASGQVAQRVKQRAQMRRHARAYARVVRPGTTYGPVQDETLWSIAKRMVEGTPFSIHQGVMAIAQKNPQAFNRNNINSLSEGALLHLPQLDEMSAISPMAAQHYIEVQNEEWNQTNGKPAIVSVAKQSGTKAKPKTNKPLKLLAPGDEPVSSTSNQTSTKKQNGSKELANRITLIEEAMETMKRSNEALQKQNEQLKKMLQEKESELKKVPQASQPTMPTDAAAPVISTQENLKSMVLPAPKPNAQEEGIAVITPDATKPSQSDVLPEPTSVADPLQPSRSAINQVEEQSVTKQSSEQTQKIITPQKTEVKPVSVAPSEQEIELSESSDMSLRGIIIAILGVLLLVLIGLLYRKNSKAQSKEVTQQGNDKQVVAFVPSESDEEIKATDFNLGNDFDLNKALEAVNRYQKKYVKDFSQQAKNTADDGKAALDEVEVYLAYERYGQAQKLLKNIIAKNPNQWEAWLKLLELYVQTEKLADFEESYQKIPKDLQDYAPRIWSKIELLRDKIDKEKAPKVIQESTNDTSHLFEDSDNINPTSEDLQSSQEEAADEIELTALPHEEEDKTEQVYEEPAPIIEPEPMTLTEGPVTEPDETLDLNKSYTLSLADEPVEQSKASGKENEQDVQDDEELETQIIELPSDDDDEYQSDENELTDLLPEVDIEEQVPSNSSRESLELTSETSESFVNEAEMTAQIALAKAYMEVGDGEAAKELLHEVLAKGTNQQKHEAQQALDELEV